MAVGLCSREGWGLSEPSWTERGGAGFFTWKRWGPLSWEPFVVINAFSLVH